MYFCNYLKNNAQQKHKNSLMYKMKSLTYYIQEKLIINSLQEKLVIKKSNQYKYFPQSKEELKSIVKKRIKDEGNEVNLNDIDVSQITDISNLFNGTDFNGDISQWDVSNVTNMYGLFYCCDKFNQDISDWDVSNVKNMYCMFSYCKNFNQDISNWDVSNVTNMTEIFWGCESFNQDISKWNVSKVTDAYRMFYNCPIKEKHKPNFK